MLGVHFHPLSDPPEFVCLRAKNGGEIDALKWGSRVEIIGGIVLLVIGFKILFDHLSQ
jgi:hypothetical protein